MRVAVAVVLGVVIAVLAACLAALVGAYVYPPPPTVDLNPELARSMIDRLPVGAFLWEVAGWGLGSFVGALVAVHLARAGAAWPALAVAAGAAASTLVAFFVWPHPIWFAVLAVAATAGAGYGGGRLAGPVGALIESVESEAA
jgi:hypothetical protein